MKDFFLNFLFSLLSGAVTIPCFLLVLRISGWYEKYKTMKAQDRIGWWLLSSSKDILDFIQNKCIRDYIGTDYLIEKEADFLIALEIIEVFKVDSKHLYFESNSELTRMTYAETFMYYFEKYLDEHNDYYFNGKKMYIEETKTNNKAECSITEYGIVYNKLFYMSRLFCEKSPKLNKNNIYWSEGRKKVLDTCQTTFYYHDY